MIWRQVRNHSKSEPAGRLQVVQVREMREDKKTSTEDSCIQTLIDRLITILFQPDYGLLQTAERPQGHGSDLAVTSFGMRVFTGERPTGCAYTLAGDLFLQTRARLTVKEFGRPHVKLQDEVVSKYLGVCFRLGGLSAARKCCLKAEIAYLLFMTSEVAAS